MALRIEDYALIGDCKTAALVGRDGSIDWLCWPRFDSAACFAALLGDADNGRWLIAPTDAPLGTRRRYRPGTLILETEFETETGSAVVIDFMPPADGADLVRIAVGRSGRVVFHTELVVRFNYGATVPWVNRLDDGAINAIAGPERLVLRTSAALYGEDLRTVGEFTVEAGQSIPFVLSYGASFQNPLPAIDGFDALARTEAFWRQWSSRCPEVGPWTEAVKRSLITLKGLTYAPTGGIVAAATTSLPERIGGVRNWDYRYCWLRDATFTLLAFMNLGFYEEARAWRDWLIRAVAGSPNQVQIMYGVGGERWLPELIVPWLPGYENSGPVRIGNDASQQLQLDVFGEIADAVWRRLNVAEPCGQLYWTIWRPLGRTRTKAFGRCAAAGNISFIRRSWLGSHSIVRRMNWNPTHSTSPGSDGATSPTKSMPKSASAVSTATLTALCRPTAPNALTPACC
jgi:GH15 family glucan-1,4-alpha-glucosidase